MYFTYLGLVLSYALRRSTVRTDIMQILAASALPAVAKFAGLKVSSSASNDVLAYIGIATLAFVVLRLCYAPFAIWREQAGEIAGLRHDLSLPERVEQEVLHKKRVKYRLRLAAEMSAYAHEVAGFQARRDLKETLPSFDRMTSTIGRAGVSRCVEQAFARAITAGYLSHNAILAKDDARLAAIRSDLINMVRGIRDVIHGEITDAELAEFLAAHPPIEG